MQSARSSSVLPKVRPRSVLLALLVLTAAGVMIGLGIWQLQRLGQRRALNARIQAQLAQPPVQLAGDALGDPADLEYRPVIVRGTYDHAQEIVLRNRSYNEVPGVRVVTPLRIEGSDSAVLVDRGWLPLSQSSPEARAAHRPRGEVSVEGIFRRSSPRPAPYLPNDPTPAPDSRLDAWYWLDIDRIQMQIPYPLLPVYVEQDPTGSAQTLPVPDHRLDLGDGPHLSYALQWFSFAAILLIGSAALARRQAGQ